MPLQSTNHLTTKNYSKYYICTSNENSNLSKHKPHSTQIRLKITLKSYIYVIVNVQYYITSRNVRMPIICTYKFNKKVQTVIFANISKI